MCGGGVPNELLANYLRRFKGSPDPEDDNDYANDDIVPQPGGGDGVAQDKGGDNQPSTCGCGDPIHCFGRANMARPRRPDSYDHQDHAYGNVVPDESRYIPEARSEESNDIPKLPKPK